MTDSGGGGLPARRFADHEVAAILRRAAAREVDADLPSPHDPTLSDLMAAAADAGLDPAEVRRAAAVVPPRQGGAATVALGAPDRRRCAAVLPGTTLPETRQELVRAAERHLERTGTVMESSPDRFQWREVHLGGRTTVTLTRADDSTEIEVRADRAGHYLGRWFLGLLGWAVLSVLAPGPIPPLAAGAAFLVVPPFLARPSWVRADARLREQLERTVMALAKVVDDGDGASPGGRGAG